MIHEMYLPEKGRQVMFAEMRELNSWNDPNLAKGDIIVPYLDIYRQRHHAIFKLDSRVILFNNVARTITVWERV